MTDLMKLIISVANDIHDWDGPNAHIGGNPECWDYLSNERKTEEIERLVQKWSRNLAIDKEVERKMGIEMWKSLGLTDV